MSDSVAPGRVLGGRYRLDVLLARGGMAAVWIAEDPVLSRQVAVKILHAELAVDEDLRTRFRHEAISAARLSHPGIVATYDTGDDDGTAYIVMQLIEGMTLRALLDERGSLEIDDAVGIAVQVADALSHAHDRGLVHRDVKPANVLVQPDGRAKVTDFGIAKAAGSKDALTRTGAVLGTARYLAPEQVNGGAIDGRTDVYALGLVFYEMLTGAVPFPAETDMAAAVARLTTEPPALRSQRVDAPETLGAIVDRSIARDPGDRFPSVAAMRDALLTENPEAAPGTLTASRAVSPSRPGPGGPGPANQGVAAAADPTEARVVAADDPPTREQSAVVVEPVYRREGRGRAGRALLVVLLLVAAGIGSVFAVQALRDGDSGGGGGGGGGVEPPTPIAIASVNDFDPAGDGEEHPELTGLVTDGDPATVWETERYNTPAFGNAKDGVGLVLTLDADADVGAVIVNADDAGWSAQIYVSPTDGGALADWGTPLAEGENLPVGDTRFELSPETSGRYVLVWLTLLPPDGRLGIGQITVES